MQIVHSSTIHWCHVVCLKELHYAIIDVVNFAHFFRSSKALKGWDNFLLAGKQIILTILDVLDVVRNWRMTFSLALDYWKRCELSINLKSSGFDGNLQINFCVTLTFLEECKRNPPPQDARRHTRTYACTHCGWILLHNDRKSRHRRIKKQRRYERLAATSQLSMW
jgi:hypothetical protein